MATSKAIRAISGESEKSGCPYIILPAGFYPSAVAEEEGAGTRIMHFDGRCGTRGRCCGVADVAACNGGKDELAKSAAEGAIACQCKTFAETAVLFILNLK